MTATDMSQIDGNGSDRSTDGVSRDTGVSISVIICSYDISRLEKLESTLDGLRSQTSDIHEIIVVFDGAERLASLIDGRSDSSMKTVELEGNNGVSIARNEGVKCATGDVVAFLDDDAVPTPTWIAELKRVYNSHKAVAVGGRIQPDISHRPLFLPREFDWLIGGTHRGFADRSVQTLRNTFGSNISFRRETFEDIGGFDEAIGRHENGQLQGEETLFCIRLYKQTGEKVWYSPYAVVEHDIDSERMSLRSLVKRAFYQGYSKAEINGSVSSPSTAEERSYLVGLFKDAIPRRLVEFLAIPILILAVGMGWIWQRIRCHLERGDRR